MTDLVEIYYALGERFEAPVYTAREPTLENLRQFVRGQVARLLDENPGLMMSIMYRVDVPEPKVQDVLQGAPATEIPDRLADLLIERQLEKIRTRRKYRSESSS